jgi:hypothetical protein
MPRVNIVNKARNDIGTCPCGNVIKKGDPYKWIKFRYGGKRVKCGSCHFKSSELTQSEFLSQAYSLNEQIDEMDTDLEPSEIESELQNIAGEFRTLGEECEEKRSNMPDQLQDSETGSMLEERASTCEEVASNLEGVDCDFDEEAAREEAKTEFEEETTVQEKEEMDKDEIEAAIEEKFVEKRKARVEEIIEEARGYSYEG